MNWTRQDTRDLIESSGVVIPISPWSVKVIRRHHNEPGLIEKISLLHQFTRDETPHVWGESDCALVVADWLVLNNNTDPAKRFRGSYSTKEECDDLLLSRGGLIGHISKCAEEIGLKEIREPEFGCIAVVGSPHSQERQWCAIWQGFRWIVKFGNSESERSGWVPFAAKPLKMWRA